MNFSILSYLLTTERYRQRAASGGGFSVPVMSEREVPPTAQPLLVTNARGGFSPTVRNSEGYARFGFSPVPLGDEPRLFLALLDALWDLSVASNWENRFNTVSDALSHMRASSFQPKSLVISEDLVASFSKDLGGVSVGELEGVRVLSAKLPLGSALLVTDPASFGVYTRVGDHLGLQLFNVRQTASVIRTDGLA